MKVIDFITFCYCVSAPCRVRLPPFSATDFSRLLQFCRADAAVHRLADLTTDGVTGRGRYSMQHGPISPAIFFAALDRA